MERVGVILVHGIGEQRRFEHLDQHIRGVVEALHVQHKGEVTVEIAGARTATNLAQQETWSAGPDPSIRIFIGPPGAPRVEIGVHEVWWADVNEPGSLLKQIRFWFWSLSVWWLPPRLKSTRKLAQTRMHTLQPSVWDLFMVRVEMFVVCAFFLVFGSTLGVLFLLAQRLFGFRTPKVVETMVNYLSSIKLYNQEVRRDAGFPPGDPADYLDALDQPPRVSIRRRMVRTIADVACGPYTRWYILAHSLGSVVAFNGIMEPAYVFPSYLDKGRWENLVAAGKAGPAGPAFTLPPANTAMHPPRPNWLPTGDIAYRPKIFERFAGFATYGCPLGKFATIWPALVPICREPAFQPGTPWLNIWDPLDPVSGPCEVFNGVVGATTAPPLLECCPRKTDVGYCDWWVLLVPHALYLKSSTPDSLAAAFANWLATGGVPAPFETPTGRFFSNRSALERLRFCVLLVEWAALLAAVWRLFAWIATKLLLLLEKPPRCDCLRPPDWAHLFTPGLPATWATAAIVLSPILTTFLFGAVARVLGNRRADQRAKRQDDDTQKAWEGTTASRRSAAPVIAVLTDTL